MSKMYYVTVVRYDADGEIISRRFVSDRAFNCLYSFVYDINDAKFFSSLKGAKDYMKNYIGASREKVLYEDMYSVL